MILMLLLMTCCHGSLVIVCKKHKLALIRGLERETIEPRFTFELRILEMKVCG